MIILIIIIITINKASQIYDKGDNCKSFIIIGIAIIIIIIRNKENRK